MLLYYIIGLKVQIESIAIERKIKKKFPFRCCVTDRISIKRKLNVPLA